jgi:hypothetical protein
VRRRRITSPVTSIHGFDRFFRAAMAQLSLIRSAALSARLAPLRAAMPISFQG